MKKFALLGAVAALATAGGVFAAWTFSTGGINGSEQTQSVSVSVDEETSTKDYGTFSLTSNSFSFKLQSEGNADVNTVEIAWGTENSVVGLYVSNNPNVDEQVELTFAWEKPSIAVGGDSDVVVTYDDITPVVLTEGSYKATLTSAIQGSISVTGDVETSSELGLVKGTNFNNKLTITATIK